MKRRFFIGLLVTGASLLPSFAHAAAHLYLSQAAGTVCEGKSYLIDLRLNAPDAAINTIQLELDWDPARMQLTDTSYSGSIFKVWPFSDVDNVAGYSKSVGGIMTPGWQGTAGLVFRPTIQVLGTGPATLTILPSTEVLLNDGYGTSTPVTFAHLTVNVVPASDPACLPPPTPTPAPTGTPGPTAPPSTPGPTPTPFVCPDAPSCTLPDEGTVIPCDIIETCPGQQDVVTVGFVTDPDVQCPIRTVCPGADLTFSPTVTPVEPGTTQQEAVNVLSQVIERQQAEQIIQTVYEARPAVGALTALSVVGGIAAVIAALSQLRGIAGGLAELGSLLWFKLLGLTHLRRKRTRFWGTVYDSFTKRPIPLAVVELLGSDNRLLEKRVTDTEGRFGFLVTPESLRASEREVQLRVSKKGYRFPSTAQIGPEVEFYKNTYRGGVVGVTQEKLLNFDVPMDPEVPPALTPRQPAKTAIIGWFTSLADASYRLSVVTAPLNFFLQPTMFNGIMVGIVALTAILRSAGIKLRPYGVVVDSTNGMAMSFAFVTLSDHEGRRIGYAVSDERGRYFLLSQGGMHELAVSSPAQVSPPRKSTQVIEAPDGWVRKKVTL